MWDELDDIGAGGGPLTLDAPPAGVAGAIVSGDASNYGPTGGFLTPRQQYAAEAAMRAAQPVQVPQWALVVLALVVVYWLLKR